MSVWPSVKDYGVLSAFMKIGRRIKFMKTPGKEIQKFAHLSLFLKAHALKQCHIFIHNGFGKAKLNPE